MSRWKTAKINQLIEEKQKFNKDVQNASEINML